MNSKLVTVKVGMPNTITENKSLTYAELLEIVDNGEFWKYFEPEEDTASDNMSIPTASTCTNDTENRNPACGQLFNKGDKSDYEDIDAEEMKTDEDRNIETSL
ncbi:hypothetical protein FQA39_LY00619 [Lamprigera yunnana]|nr:hypothetical protein FQA39_LY00619 [Lamprigera yunnana]